MDWLTAISVLSAAAVSIVSVFIPLRIEGKKANRESLLRVQAAKQAENAEIERVTLDLLATLSRFNIDEETSYRDALEVTGWVRVVPEGISKLQSCFYAWEMRIWGKLDTGEQTRVEEIRKLLQGLVYELRGGHGFIRSGKDMFQNIVPRIVSEILELSRVTYIR